MNDPLVYMLDTNMASYLIGGRSKAARERLRAELLLSRVAVSSLTQGEILFGLEKKPGAARLLAEVNAFFESVPVLAWDSAAARAYGKLRLKLETTGKSLAVMDLLIGAHAIAKGAVLVTKDRAFQQVSVFLQTVDWADDL